MLRILWFSLFVSLTARALAEVDDGLTLNRERFGHAVVSVGGDLYVLGGAANEGMAAELERLGPDRSAWEVIGEMPNPRYWVDAVTDGTVIYVAGGTRLSEEGPNPLVDTFEKWNPATGDWTSLAPLPVARAHVALAWLGGRIYAIGGSDGQAGRSAQVDIYDPETDTWSRGPDMPTARECEVVAYQGKLYAFGGYDGRSSVTAFEVYDPEADHWEKFPDLPFLLSAHHAVVVDGVLYTFGHYHQPGRVSAYDFTSRGWSLLELPYEPSRHNDVVFDGREVFVIGGNVTGAAPFLDLVQRFTPKQLEEASRRPPGEAEALEVERSKPFELSAETEAAVIAWAEKLAEIQTLSGDWVQTYVSKDGSETPGDVISMILDRPGKAYRYAGQHYSTYIKDDRITMAAHGSRRYLEQGLEAFTTELGTRSVSVMSGLSLPDLDALTMEDPLPSLMQEAVARRWKLDPPSSDEEDGFWRFSGERDMGGGQESMQFQLRVSRATGLIESHRIDAEVVYTDGSGQVQTNDWSQITEAVGADVNEVVNTNALTFEPGPDWTRVEAREDLFPQPDRSRFALSGKPAPDFTLTLLDGEPFTLSESTGKVVVIDFWATWCGPCVRALPEVQKLHETWGTGDVVVVGVSTDDPVNEKRVRSMVEEKKLTYRIGIDTNETGNAYYVSGIPTLVLVDRNGIVQGREIGYSSSLAQTLGEKVAQLLEGKTLPGGEPLAEGEQPEQAASSQPEARMDPRYFQTLWELEPEADRASEARMIYLPPVSVEMPSAYLVREEAGSVSALDPATGRTEASLNLATGDVPEGQSRTERWEAIRDPDHTLLFIRLRTDKVMEKKEGRQYYRTVDCSLTALTPEGEEVWSVPAPRGDLVLKALALGPDRDGVILQNFNGLQFYNHKGHLLARQTLKRSQSLRIFDHDGDGVPEFHLLGNRVGAYQFRNQR